MRDGDLRKSHGDPGAREAISIPSSMDGRAPFLRRRMENLTERVLGLDPGEAHATARLRDDFGVDFLDLLELALAMEAELDVQIPERALKEVTTVDDLIRVASRALTPEPGSVAFHGDREPRPLRERVRHAARRR